MDAKYIQSRVQQYLFIKSHPYQVLNFARLGYSESDVLAVTKSNLVTEVEVKISLSDYKADFNKNYKHYKMINPGDQMHSKTPNRFYYACPEGLIKEQILPTYAGLMYVNGFGEVNIIKKAPLLHKIKCDDMLFMAMLENLTAKTVLGCQLMTWKNKNRGHYLN